MNIITALVHFLDRFSQLTGRVIAWFTLLMVVITFLIVVLRYGFNLGWIAMQESVLYFHGLVFLLGAAYTLKEDGHVRVDIFYQRFSDKGKAWVNLLGTLFLLLPFCVFVFTISFDYVASAWRIMEKSGEAGGLPFVYLSKSYLLLFAFALALQGLSELGKNTLILVKAKEA
ncbi:TRAP transporter small permease subunit [Thalassotalea agarivorans]|uniref:TRAP transporter small permease protein n=1 Tax=Thalassotalea agarivorans TaxID=349064 RepID=A0A1H9YFM4_THASX|nr:TRAP transporter small permease subunit [Thalassotalea agarivorans]SES67823.1 TRAP-type mannitol/chloroaromatic compound transport system, small permease component [Thalassotalea agarivorans]